MPSKRSPIVGMDIEEHLRHTRLALNQTNEFRGRVIDQKVPEWVTIDF